jgi:tetratricopeptide (TPR) repeat protein
VADLAGRLRDRVLPQLAAEERAVAAAFSTSYLALPKPLRRLFRLLGVYPGERIDAAAAAALADIGVPEADDGLDALHAVHLLEATADGAYRMHDLIHEYAASLAAEDPEEQRAAAIRLLDHAVHRAAAVSLPIESSHSRLNRRLGAPLRPDLIPDPATDPVRWFDQYRHDHMALLNLAETLGASSYVWMLARSAWRLWYLYGQFEDVVDAHRRGLRAARSIPDDVAAAVMANYLASGLHRLGRAREAAQVLSDAQKLPPEQRRAIALDAALRANLSYTQLAIGDVNVAAESAAESLRLARRHEPNALVQALNAVGAARAAQGALTESLAWHRRELLAAVTGGTTVGVVHALNNVAVTRMRLGHRPARRLLTLSIALNRRFRNGHGLVEVTSALAVLHRNDGDLPLAIARHREAVETARHLSDPRLQATVHNDFAETMVAAGDLPGATDLFRHAHRLATQAEARDEEARSLEGLALASTDPRTRHEYLERALAIYRRINVDVHVRRVEGRLGSSRSEAATRPVSRTRSRS